MSLHSTAFWRFASIVWDRSDIVDTTHLKSGSDKSTQCRFPPRTRTFNLDFNLSHPNISSFFGCISQSVLCRKRSAFTRSLKTEDAGTAPGNYVPLFIGNGNDSIIESRINKNNTFRYVLFYLSFFCYSHNLHLY